MIDAQGNLDELEEVDLQEQQDKVEGELEAANKCEFFVRISNFIFLVVDELKTNLTEPNTKHATAVDGASEKIGQLTTQVEKAGELVKNAGKVTEQAQVLLNYTKMSF
jgi:hypothetical protein